MKHPEGFHPQTVIYVGAGSWPQVAPHGPGLASGDVAGHAARRAAELAALAGGDAVAQGGRCDPYRVNAQFPARWTRYIRSHFRSIPQVVAAFQVSERTARKWWDGDNGANGGHVAVACLTHPDTAPQMLFAAE